MAGVAFLEKLTFPKARLKAMGLASATESYAASALYTTRASLSGGVWRIRRVSS